MHFSYSVDRKQFTWPLDVANGNKELCRTHSEISTDVTINNNGAYFPGNGEYGAIMDLQASITTQFSFIARVYPTSSSDGPLLNWTTKSNKLHIWYLVGKLYGVIVFEGNACPTLAMHSNSLLSLNQWHTVAMSFNGLTGQYHNWVDGQLTTKEVDPCAASVLVSEDAYVATR